MHIICSDLEGIFVPEIWINVAEKTGIKELSLTTRDISDYDVLMKKRLALLDEHGLKIDDIKQVIATMSPLEGALEFLDWLRSLTQVVFVSDTFVQFARPLMKKLGWPTLFCHHLAIDADGSITGYVLRQKDGKREVAIALKNLNYDTIAIGDSFNDITMLREADIGILFRPPEKIKNDFPEFPVTYTYDELKTRIQKILSDDPT